MTTTTTTPKFQLGLIIATVGATEAFANTGQTPLPFLKRHLSGDWGDLCDEDRLLNEQALIDGSRLLSAYRLADGTKIWCITEACGENGQREATTFLLPSEY